MLQIVYAIGSLQVEVTVFYSVELQPKRHLLKGLVSCGIIIAIKVYLALTLLHSCLCVELYLTAAHVASSLYIFLSAMTGFRPHDDLIKLRQVDFSMGHCWDIPDSADDSAIVPLSP